jgi:hypothetical protein
MAGRQASGFQVPEDAPLDPGVRGHWGALEEEAILERGREWLSSSKASFGDVKCVTDWMRFTAYTRQEGEFITCHLG